VQIEASVGIALFPEHGRDAADVLRRADAAMYQAKRSRSGHALYEASATA
jgi:predicted signal transduction protein with EAL and GGDEF domain